MLAMTLQHPHKHRRLWKGMNITMKNKPLNTKTQLTEGMRDGIPIGMGYFAVSFSLGIAAKRVGLSPFQGFLTSALINASAGEYAGFVLIGANAAYLEMALITLITNARYFLMSCALSQKINPNTPLHHRLLLGYNINDEIFGISIARQGFLSPYYTYGAIITAAPCWAIGTMLGIIAGNLLPLRIVSALSVALYGMFLAVIIPPSRKSKTIAILVVISFILSFIASILPISAEISEGTRTIILTVAISAAAAIIKPVKQEENTHDA